MNNTFLSHISLLRVIAMVTVVLHHALCFYGAWFPYDGSQSYLHFTMALKDVNMPMFVFLAGFIYAYLRLTHGKYNDTDDFIVGKIKRLLLPYLLWSIVLLTPLNLAMVGARTIFYGIWQMWFLLMLFLEFLFFHFTFLFWAKTSLAADCCIFAVLSVISSFIMPRLSDYYGIDLSLLCFDKFIHYMPFFFLGAAVSKHKSKLSVPLIAAVIVTVAASAAIVAVNFFFLDIKGSGECIFIFVCAVLISSFAATEKLCGRFPAIASSKVIADLDKSAMGIYILHHILILDFVSLPIGAEFMNEHVILAPVAVFAVSLLLSWAMTHAILRTRLRFVFG